MSNEKQFTRLIGIHGSTQEEANQQAEAAMECISFFAQLESSPYELKEMALKLQKENAELLEQRKELLTFLECQVMFENEGGFYFDGQDYKGAIAKHTLNIIRHNALLKAKGK